jgi:MBOAT, membrane-bound O-acyltransferase family
MDTRVQHLICRYAGFDGYDDETGINKGWNIARGADIWILETCDSIKVGTKAWNKKTSQWLLRYVYIRNMNRLGIVYAVCAIWHGFYPGKPTQSPPALAACKGCRKLMSPLTFLQLKATTSWHSPFG